MVHKILFFNQLFLNSSIKESNNNSHELVKFILANAKILRISNDICVNLFQKDLLAKSLHVIFNSFNEIVISIDHPATSYEDISKIINDALKQNENTSMQIEITDVDKQNDVHQ